MHCSAKSGLDEEQKNLQNQQSESGSTVATSNWEHSKEITSLLLLLLLF